MTPAEKMAFVAEILDSLSREYAKRVALAPDHWDGVELRWLLNDVVEDQFVYVPPIKRIERGMRYKNMRYKNYENDRLTIAEV